MDTQDNQVALPLRNHTIFGVCEGIGEDFGFNPVFLRVALSAMVLWSPMIAIGTYFALGLVVLASRLLVPEHKADAATAQVAVAANEPHEYAVAA